jgi:three-Cys-motif partner protein
VAGNLRVNVSNGTEYGLLQTTDQIVYVDAFAGAGHYPDGLGISKGSPVIACESALNARTARPQWRPHLRFIERSPETADELRQELTRFDGALDYDVVQGDAAKELPGLIAATCGVPTLVFVDPDGFAPVTFDLLKSLAGRVTMTEILLSVDAQGIMRAHARGETAALTVLPDPPTEGEQAHSPVLPSLFLVSITNRRPPRPYGWPTQIPNA